VAEQDQPLGVLGVRGETTSGGLGHDFLVGTAAPDPERGEALCSQFRGVFVAFLHHRKHLSSEPAREVGCVSHQGLKADLGHDEHDHPAVSQVRAPSIDRAPVITVERGSVQQDDLVGLTGDGVDQLITTRGGESSQSDGGRERAHLLGQRGDGVSSGIAQ
jgi:hypothetical protein